MNERQLADRIGNVKDGLVQEANASQHRKKLWQRLAAVAAAIAIVAGVAGWLALRGAPLSASAVDLMAGINASKNILTTDVNGPGAAAVTDFGLRLLRECGAGDKNTLLSPLSVICALGMTANGAQAETLAQMEQVLGLPMDELNAYLYSYLAALSPEEINVANSIWMRDDESFEVRDAFLQANADYYGAAAYKAPFDKTTVRDINNWVKDNTHGMIDGILKELDGAAVMVLVNALAFEAEWTSVYTKDDVWDRTFTTEDGQERTVEMMYDSLGDYISDDYADGFIKNYKGGQYAFAALLPREGMTVAEYLATLTGESLHEMLVNADSTQYGSTGLPKFKLEYAATLNDALIAMGMTDAFDEDAADFDGIGRYVGYMDYPLYIDTVIHKTYIEVAERGTRAGAATAVAATGGAGMPPSERKDIILDRPFVYMIIDTEANVPIFIGTVLDIGK